jgi:hypothetical protein
VLQRCLVNVRISFATSGGWQIVSNTHCKRSKLQNSLAREIITGL